jgi:hypothetical protein
MMISPLLIREICGDTFLEVGEEGLDEVVDGWTSLDEEHNSTGTFEHRA